MLKNCVEMWKRKNLACSTEGAVIKINYLGGKLASSEMFRDDLWWQSAPDSESGYIRRIEVKPNPMVLKAEQIFRDALKK